MQCTKIRSDAAEIKKDSYLEQSKIRKGGKALLRRAVRDTRLRCTVSHGGLPTCVRSCRCPLKVGYPVALGRPGTDVMPWMV